MRSCVASAAVSLLIAGCPGNSGPPAKSVGPPAQSEPEAARAEGESAREPTPAPVAPPRLRLSLEPTAEGGFALSLQNRDAESVSLASRLVLEQAQDDRFAAVPGSSPALRRDCNTAAARCVTLAPGAELLPPAVRSREGDAQCTCGDCTPLPRGRYRLVVQGCDAAFSVASPPISLP